MEIEAILEASSLTGAIKERSLRMFRLIAKAEASVHGTTMDKVHFHEVGAVDSIVDIVAAAAAIEYLKPDRILSFPPELGGGFVHCAHGKIPVPAPATVKILEGTECRRGAVDKETTTPHRRGNSCRQCGRLYHCRKLHNKEYRLRPRKTGTYHPQCLTGIYGRDQREAGDH